jgi:hypothetical protein
MTPRVDATKTIVADACASSRATAIGMNGTRIQGQAAPERRKRRTGAAS